MNIARGTAFSVIFGLVGAAVWAGVAFGTGYEIGWIAWGVGFLAGLGFALGSGGRGMQAGAIAVGITICSILLAKYITVELVLRSEIGSEEEIIQQLSEDLKDEERVISYLADDIIHEMNARGETVTWPPGIHPAYACEEGHYPPEIWATASTLWKEMPPEDKQAYRGQLIENAKSNIDTFMMEATRESFWHSFQAMDILFFALAVITAFQIASKGKGGGEAPDSVADEKPGVNGG